MTKLGSYSRFPDNNKRQPLMETIADIETRLWSSADTLRVNSNYVSNEYFLPVMGLIFLCHAFSRFERVKTQIELMLLRWHAVCGQSEDTAPQEHLLAQRHSPAQTANWPTRTKETHA